MDNYIGEIRIFAGNYAPENWHLCDGGLLPINDYQELFSLLGFTYGGDGIQFFALPDLRGKLPVGSGALFGGSTYNLGDQGGSVAVTITNDGIPPHSHTLNATTNIATTGEPGNNFLATSNGSEYSDGVNLYTPLPAGITQPNATMDLSSVSPTGRGQNHENKQPYMCINYIIALGGLYPQD